MDQRSCWGLANRKRSCTCVMIPMFFFSRVFRTMFKEFKPSSGSGRLSSPLLRRRIPTVSHQYMSPQNSRKYRIPGIGRMKKKRSVPEGLTRVASPDSSSMSVAPAFCEDPRNLQIKEQVCVCVCACAFNMPCLCECLAGCTH